MDLKTDLDCLIECLRYRHDDAAKAKDVILTIASLCSGSDEAQNFLRTSGGLSFLVNLLSTTKDEEIRVAALYALGCAIERNVFSQSRLCTEAMFQFLYCQLPNERSSVQMKRTSTFLIMCLVTNNGKGQTLVRKTKCLDAMLQLFRQYPGLHLPYSPDSGSVNEEDQKLSLELWKEVTGTLCGCVNNPQNDENQLVCASSVPAALYIMSHVHDSHVIQLLCSYISLLAANNAVNQDRFHLLGGLEVIVTKLTSIIDDIIMEPEKGLISSASNMISMLSSVIADNVKTPSDSVQWLQRNKDFCNGCHRSFLSRFGQGENSKHNDNNLKALSTLKVVPLLLKLLALDVISQGVKLKVIITLGCLVSADEGSKKQVVECDGLKLLLSFMMANQDEECAKASMLVLHTCISSDNDTVAEKERNDIMSEKGHHSSENEGQVEERPLSRGQYEHLEAKIEILQKTLMEERRLRKSLEEEKASLQPSKEESIASTSQEGDDDNACIQDMPLKPHSKSTAPTAEDQGVEQKVASDPDISIQSSHSFVQLQERMNAVEQKLKSITAGTTETDMKNTITTSDTSGSESADDFHRSVSEAENEEIEPLNESHPQNNFRHCEKKESQAMTKENTCKDSCKQHLTAEKDQCEETPQFKMPPPVKRCRPLQLIHGNVAGKEIKSISSKIKAPPSKNKHQQCRGEVTPPTKVQKVDLSGQVKRQEYFGQCVPPGTSSGKRSLRTRRSSGSSVYRTLIYNDVDDRSVSTAYLGKEKQKNGKSDSDADSESSDASEVSSIADSVFSSLNLHLSCPIKPIKHNLPQPVRPSPVQSFIKSPQIVIKPVRSKVHVPTPESKKNVTYFSKECGAGSDRISKSDKVYDFVEDVADSKKESSHILPSFIAADHFRHYGTSKELVTKLKATPKVMLKKYSFKGKNMQMYTFDGKAQAKGSVHSSNSKKLSSHQGLDERMSRPQKHQGRFGSHKGSGLFTSKDSDTRGSGSKRKSYSVHYVRGKIQCSRLYRSASLGIGRTTDDYSSWLTCPGCVPPRHCPLLDSRTLLYTLKICKHDLCRKHTRLMNSVASYISNKAKIFGL